MFLVSQDEVCGRGYSGEQQGAQSAQVPQDVVLHHAGRSPAAAPDGPGGDDVFSQPQARREDAECREEQSGTCVSHHSSLHRRAWMKVGHFHRTKLPHPARQPLPPELRVTAWTSLSFSLTLFSLACLLLIYQTDMHTCGTIVVVHINAHRHRDYGETF